MTNKTDQQKFELKTKRLNERHMMTLTEYVQNLRDRTPDAFIPNFDPEDGGLEAKILFLYEKPSRKTDPREGGSGFISQDNNDETARATKRFLREAGIDRKDVIFWNAIPAWNGTRKITKKETRYSAEQLTELLKILRNVRSIVLVGKRAHNAVKNLKLREQYSVTDCLHPSPINRNTRKSEWENIPNCWREAAAKLRD